MSKMQLVSLGMVAVAGVFWYGFVTDAAQRAVWFVAAILTTIYALYTVARVIAAWRKL